MIGLRKISAGALFATSALLAISTGALACTTSGSGNGNGGDDAHQTSQHTDRTDSSSCQASGNQQITNVHYTTKSGTFTGLSGHVASGDQVVASFTVPAHCSVEASLVSYQAPSGSFDSKTASQQKVFDSQDQTLSAGAHSLTVKVPGCFFQVDFVRGAVIQHLGPDGSSNFYSAQGRLIAGDNGGSQSCSTTTTTTTPTCVNNPQLSGVSYLLGGSKTVNDLRGHVVQGETVKATFTVPANCSMQLSLAAYQAPLPYFTRASAPQQKLVDSQTGTFGAGVHSMQVTVPGCMFQVDFVHGAVLTQLGSTPATDYEDRLISADNGGNAACTSAVTTPTPTPVTTPTPTPTPVTTPTPTPVSTPTPTPVSTPTPSSTPTPITTTTTNTTSPPGGVLGTSTSTPNTGSNLGLTMGLAVIVFLLGFILLGCSGLVRRSDEV